MEIQKFENITEKLIAQVPVDLSEAEKIVSSFKPQMQLITDCNTDFEKFRNVQESDITDSIVKSARSLRLRYVQIRGKNGIDGIRVKGKSFALLVGQAWDGMANILKLQITQNELVLDQIEKFAEIKEKKRLDQLQKDRVDILSKYVADASERNLSDMEEDVWEVYYLAKKQAHEDLIAAEALAEAERVKKAADDAAEQVRIKAENERLKKEAEARELEVKKERAKQDKIEAERKKDEAEKQRIAAAEKAEIKAKHDAELAEAKARQDKIEAELAASNAKAELAAKKIKDEEEAKRLKEVAKKEADKKAAKNTQYIEWKNVNNYSDNDVIKKEMQEDGKTKFTIFRAIAEITI